MWMDFLYGFVGIKKLHSWLWDGAIFFPYRQAFQSPFEGCMVLCCGWCRRQNLTSQSLLLLPYPFLKVVVLKWEYISFWFIIFHSYLELRCVQYYNCEWCKLTLTQRFLKAESDECSHNICSKMWVSILFYWLWWILTLLWIYRIKDHKKIS